MAEIPDWLERGGLGAAEQGINRLLRLDPDSHQRLAPLAGRTLRVRLVDTPVNLVCLFSGEGLSLERADEDGEADAVVETSLAGLIALAGSGGERSRDVAFRGDVGVVQEVKRLFGELEVDWEEQLSHITGDIVAHRVGEAARGGQSWGREAGETFLRNLGEYLTEERALIAPEAALAGFVEDVRGLRADVDRLEARLRRLERDAGG